VNILYAGIIFFALCCALVLQEWTPAFVAMAGAVTGWDIADPDWACRARFLALAAFFFPAALTLPFPGMLALALGTGLLWDASHAYVPPPSETGALEEGGSWGGGIILMVSLGSLMHGVRPMFLARRWTLPVIMCFACIAIFLVGEYTWIHIRSGGFYFPEGFWQKVAISTLMTGAATPLVLFLLSRALAATGAEPDRPATGYR